MTRIRPARTRDAPVVRSIHVTSIRTFGHEAYDEEEVPVWETYEQGEEPFDGLDDPGVYCIVAEHAADVVGFGRLDADEAEVPAVYVHPDHAGAGVGSALLAGLEGYARDVGLTTLGVWAPPNAVEFYEETGYEWVRTATHETGDVELDCVVMEKVL